MKLRSSGREKRRKKKENSKKRKERYLILRGQFDRETESSFRSEGPKRATCSS